jgi:3-mercaptopropionate dioxygenase
MLASHESQCIRSRKTTNGGMQRIISELAIEVAVAIKTAGDDEPQICARVAAALGAALSHVGWIPFDLRQPAKNGYRRELLHEAADGSFSIGCFVWGLNQQTPIHDHNAWSVVGCAIGRLKSEPFALMPNGRLVPGNPQFVDTGDCLWSQPDETDIHRVGADNSGYAVSVHVYGCRFADVCARKYSTDQLAAIS